METMFKNFKDHSSLISEINTAIAKYTIKYPEIKCFISIHNNSESMTVTNIKNSDVVELLDNITKSYSTSTAATSFIEYS